MPHFFREKIPQIENSPIISTPSAIVLYLKSGCST